MADVITRLKVESSEYDQKLQRATQQLQHMEKEVRRTGATFAYADKEEIAFIQSLGSMETRAATAKQKLREYSDAIASMTSTFRSMTDEEKSSQFGKAMAASIDQLKIKAAELQDVMSDTNREIQNLASDTSFTQGMSMMTRTIGSCAAAITAWTGDSKEMEVVMKDLAKIGTTVAAVDQLTKAFQKQNLVLLKNPYVAAAAAVVALGVAIGKLIKKSQELSAVEKDLQDVQKKGRENSAQEITRIQTLNNILHDNTRSIDERKTALQEIQALVPEYHGALTSEGTLINDNTDALSGYVAELQRAATAQAAFDRMVEINKQKLAKQVELKQATEKRDKYQADVNRPITKEEMMAQAGSGRNIYGSVSDTKQTLLNAAQAEVDTLTGEINEFNAELSALQQLVNAAGLGAGNTRTTKTTSTTAKSSGSGYQLANYLEMPEAGSLADLERRAAEVQASMGGATTNKEYAKMEAHLQTIIDKMNEIKGVKEETFTPGSLNALNQELRAAQETLANMSPEAEGWADALKKVIDKQKEIKDLQDKINSSGEVTTDTASMTAKGWDAVMGAIGQVGGALQSLEDPSAKVAGIIAQAVAEVAAGLAQMLAAPQSTAQSWGWIPLAISGTATMISTIAAIKSATKGFAEGGMVTGNSYSGDNIVARLNAGEGILTARGVENAASVAAMAGNPLDNLNLSMEVEGTKMLVLLNNTNRSLGGSRNFYTERH